ncbi:hypothetical protein Ais01nite_41960 [Asanoa ishikariensis]|uniref:YqjF family protein n=1 Tax=Asanoa ishikariensis TaxID=137265 RepID=UPI001A468784|nr:DUF2071 domain-containing protein [Asanoa ishikariensis]GIF66161.1 hypothetical protein Ais01nite_41960 [Asanoa ishikariensis]
MSALQVVVERPVMFQTWRDLTFLHWRYPATAVQELLPPGLTVDTHDGDAWVGLVPFVMAGIRAPYVPALPWLSRFPETNVRTYVIGPDGRAGIWFFSLDAARLAPVVVARLTYSLPYVWSDMSVRVDGPTQHYLCRRHRTPDQRCDATVRVGPPIPEPSPLEEFLTARHRLYSVRSGRMVAADAEHGPWPLRRGELLDLDQNLLEAGGLPAPVGDPLVHASAGVLVRVSGWREVSSGS